MVTNRTRTLGPSYTTGWRAKAGVEGYLPPRPSSFTTMDDTIGNMSGNNPLFLERYVAGDSWTGDNMQPGLFHRACTNYASNRYIASHITMPTPGLAAIAADAAARSNPARSHVSVPNFIFELKDIPQLIYKGGKGILGGIASANLSWQFAIKPFISDINKLLDFSSAYEKRVKEIEDLESGRLKRRVAISIDEETEVGSPFVMESYLFFATSSPKTVTKRTIWAHTYWAPNMSLSSNLGSSGDSRRDYIRKLLLGLHWHQFPINAWNAIPWSWLIDWCSSAGDFIAGTNNSVGYLCEPVVICIHTQSERTDKFSGVPDWCGGNSSWSSTRDTKERYTMPPGLSASVPLFTKRQLSILGSLYVLKR